jgi:hypothetical protein
MLFKSMLKSLFTLLICCVVHLATADTRCDCSQIVASCTATVTVRDQKWIDVESTSQQCSRVDYYLDENPHLTVVLDGQSTQEWLGPGVVHKVKVDQCVVCVDHLRGQSSSGSSTITGSSSNASSITTLSGSWQGQYSYNDSRTPVPMSVDLSDENGQLSGRTTEPNTFGDPSASQLFADVSGSRSGARIQFVKRYDGTGGQHHSVQYSGTIDALGSQISGTWSLPGVSGRFVLRKLNLR